MRRRKFKPGRVIRLAATLSLLIPAISYISYVSSPNGLPLGVLTVEWLRDNGAGAIVTQVERWYYSLTAPSKGGPALKKLPTQAGSQVSSTARGRVLGTGRTKVPVHYLPPEIVPLIHPALPGEGIWRSTFKERGVKYPPVLITSYRSSPAYPQLVAGVAWIDHTEADVQLYPGIEEPAVSLPNRGPEEVPTSLRYKLVATFNSAFRLADSTGGFALNGVTYAPLRAGVATIVKYRSGKVNVISWKAGPDVGNNIVYARQNLPLIIDNGQLNPNMNDGPQWGATLGNAIQVWRSGVGVDKYGNLIYATANYQTVSSLAAILKHAGAVRAMELDINAEWPSFITYTGPGAVGAANLLPGMNRSPDRYLIPDDRDFFAVYLANKPSTGTAKLP